MHHCGRKEQVRNGGDFTAVGRMSGDNLHALEPVCDEAVSDGRESFGTHLLTQMGFGFVRREEKL